MSIKTANKKSENKTKKKINKKRLVILVVIGIIIIIILLILRFTIFNKSWKEANDKYTISYEIVYNKNIELDNLIKKAEKLVNSKNKALDEVIRKNLVSEIRKAKESKKELTIKPVLIKKIIKETNKLNKVNYENTIEILKSLYDELNLSIKKYNLVDNPAEEYVVSRLKEINEIYNITPYTEDTDKDRYLGKPKRYYSKIVFQHKKVEHYGLENNLMSITEVGNSAGGCVEIFKTVEDAENRNQELKDLEGTNRSPGSHKVIGTILIRTSDDLTKSQQEKLEEKIIEVLTKLDDKIEEEPAEDVEILDKMEPSTTNNEKSKDKMVFYGGTTASLGWSGNGVLNIKNVFSSEDEINFTGKITGFTGRKYITLIQSFPNGDYFIDTFDVQSGDVIGFGYVDCGVGNGSFTVKLTDTGEVLGYYEFTIQ